MQRNITLPDELLALTGATKLGDLLLLRAVYKNWYHVLTRRAAGEFRPRENLEIDERSSTISYMHNGERINFHFTDKAQMENTIFLITENFSNEEYRDLDVKGKDVLDIGANIGDTAIYFALKGAKQVYAIEPFPYSYNSAKTNMRLNRKLGDSITLINQGIGAAKGTVRLAHSFKSTGGSAIQATKEGKPVGITTIKAVLDRYKLDDAVLKMDCEGYEYASLLNTDNKTLRRFSQMCIEYHYGYLDLEKKLREAGFSTRHTRPRIVYYNRKMRVGLIFARRT